MAQLTVKLPDGKTQVLSHPDDWSDEQVQRAVDEQFPQFSQGSSQVPSTPFNKQEAQTEESPEEQELKGWKGLGKDAVEMLKNSLKGGIGFLGRAPGEAADVAGQLIQHPLSYPIHMDKQVIASLAGTAKDILNIPHASIKELGKKELIPEWLKKYNELPFTHIPEDTGVEKFFGAEPTRKSDELVRAIPELVLGGKGLTKGIKGVASGLKGPDLNVALKETQALVNQKGKQGGKVFRHIETEAEKRGIDKVSIDQSVLKEAESHLPKTKANKALLSQAKTGDYKALRKLQADLRVKGEKALSSALTAENDAGELMMETRDDINKSIQDHLEKQGAKDLADALKSERDAYRERMKTYFSSPALAKVFGKSQKIPTNPLTLLKEDSTEMNRFMKAHPEMKVMMEKALTHKKTMKRLGKIGAALGTGTVGGTAYKILS